jgi:formylglycine-generating enzyme required for sulfatase activity
MRDVPPGMAWAPGGMFRMASEAFPLEEAPVRAVAVDRFGFRCAVRSCHEHDRA